MASPKIALLPGDGVGPEVLEAALEILEAVGAHFEYQTHRFGGAAIDVDGDPLPAATFEGCQSAAAILLGAVGGPKWDGGGPRPEAGLLGLRKGLGLFANLRPVRPLLAVAEAASPLKRQALEEVDLIVVRELTGDIYFGEPRGREQEGDEVKAVDTAVYRSSEVQRIAELGFSLAAKRKKKVTSVDKANVLETSRLWREVVTETHQRHPHVVLEHQLVDAAAMRLLTHAKSFDVLLTGNLFGDILSDEAAVLAGGIGLLPSASLGEGRRGLYEPIHGSAPDIAGQGIANPVGTILSGAMMLEHSLDRPDLARKIERAVEKTLSEGARTPDLGGKHTTKSMTRAIKERLED